MPYFPLSFTLMHYLQIAVTTKNKGFQRLGHLSRYFRTFISVTDKFLQFVVCCILHFVVYSVVLCIVVCCILYYPIETTV